MQRLQILLIGIFLVLFSGVRPLAQTRSRTPANVPMVTYIDLVDHVSFGYPVVWKLNNNAKFYLAPHILQGGLSPKAQVIFSPAENVYAKTTLADLVFVYAKSPAQSQQACSTLAIGSVPEKPETVLIQGVSFQHFDTEDAGMCHEVEQHVYWTYRNNTCYLFEGDLHTSCPGLYEGQRTLTPAETRALQRHLNAIPLTIRFNLSR